MKSLFNIFGKKKRAKKQQEQTPESAVEEIALASQDEPTKKFRDTKVGKFIKDKAPDVLDVVGDLLPSNGVFGVVKNLIDKSTTISEADKAEIYKHLTEAYGSEVADRTSARVRQVEMTKAGSHDWLFYLTGMVGLGVFVFLVYSITYVQVPEKNTDLWIHLIGICEGVVLSIFGYFFGSAMKKNVE